MPDKQKLLDYIENTWDELTVTIHDDNETHLGLPNPFVAPSVREVDGFVFKEQFYWDTYFTILPLVGSERHLLAKGMVENLLNLVERLGYAPNSNNRYHLGRSQPPFLAQMVSLIFEADNDMDWLTRAYPIVKAEYNQVWLASEHPHDRKVYEGLSRYYHEDKSHYGAEDESGWDKTTRFSDEALNYLSIDLNCFLYAYEKKFAEFSKLLGHEDVEYWLEVAEKRKNKINKLMWNEAVGLYLDYNFVDKQQGKVQSLAAYTSLFCGLADKVEAGKLKDSLSNFETDYGLTTTNKNDKPVEKKQWSSPNGWAPLHLMAVEGLNLYGFQADARRIAEKWVDTVLAKFEDDGRIYEKYNMVDPDREPTSALYPDQDGFAWTNAITKYLIDKYLV